MTLRVAMLCGVLGCGSVASSATGADAGDVHDAAPPDAAPPCDPLAAFGPPTSLAGLTGTGLTLLVPHLSVDERTLYFAAQAPGGDYDLYVAERDAIDAPFRPPTMLSLSTPGDDFDPYVTADGSALWFARDDRLYVATRQSGGEFGAAGIAAVQGPDAGNLDAQPFVTADNSEVWFTSSRTPSLGLTDVWHAARSVAGFAAPVAEPGLSSVAYDYFPTLSADRLTIYVSSTRTDAPAKGGFDIWRSTRATVDQAFPAPTAVDELNTATDDLVGWLSPDGCRIYGETNRAGGDAFFVASRR